ncbi:hypothetical protein AHQ40_001402 [Salmonella enterica subsp. enterica serovar Lexington]|nr:hypothetical protein [Salmonella enterica]ECH6832110.1 hypothetical protein [Salmonella enterica subsp. enterica serovar Oslo]EDS5930779.1 hypothetical protein [Salmonella enterica subsp. enterica serovar Lexington]EDX9179953.1 hypothetical protein [Salmonella enterica subsp. enterica serovar Lexington]ELP2097849.1 hypothetical protein [Salmonella enterica subsp. enterica serovar Lexington]
MERYCAIYAAFRHSCKPRFKRNDKSGCGRTAKRPERRRHSGQKTICENYRRGNVEYHYTW